MIIKLGRRDLDMTDIFSKLEIYGLAWFLSISTTMSVIQYKIYKTNRIMTFGWNPNIFAGFSPLYQGNITN